MNYETRDDGRIVGTVVLNDVRVDFVAKEIHKLRGAVRAWIGIQIAGHRAFDRINADSDRERTHLANSAHKGLGNNPPFGPSELKSQLDSFTYGLWKEYLGQVQVEAVCGDRKLRQKYIMRPYFVEGAGVIAFAPPGTGKSFTGLGIAVTVDHGLADSPFGEPLNRFPALYINLERSKGSMQARLADVNAAFGLQEERPLLMINARGKTLADVFEQAKDYVIKNGVKFVVLDSISRSGYGDLNDNEASNRIMDALNGLGVAWLAIAHTPRADKAHVYGSVMQDAAADVMLAVNGLKDANTGKIVIQLDVTKANDIPWPAKRYVAYEFGDEGLGSIREASGDEYVALDAASQQDETLQALVDDRLANGEWSGSDLATALDRPRTKVAMVLSQGERDGAYESRRDGHKVLYRRRVTRDTTDNTSHRSGTGGVGVTPPSTKGGTVTVSCVKCGRETGQPHMSTEGEMVCVRCFEIAP